MYGTCGPCRHTLIQELGSLAALFNTLLRNPSAAAQVRPDLARGIWAEGKKRGYKICTEIPDFHCITKRTSLVETISGSRATKQEDAWGTYALYQHHASLKAMSLLQNRHCEHSAAAAGALSSQCQGMWA